LTIRSAFSFILAALLPFSAPAAEDIPVSSPSGVLIDRALPLAHLESMDGSASSMPVSLSRWRQAVFELRKASEFDLGWPTPRNLERAAMAGLDRNSIPLALVHARYDAMDGLADMRSARVFSFSPLLEKSYDGAALEFVIDRDSMLTHGVSLISSMRIDAGDGLGWRTLEPGHPLAVSYGSTGTKNLSLQATLIDGSVVYAASKLDVVALATPDPTDTWAISATQTWDGLAGSGQAYIYLADGHSELTNPVVVVEGFDIDNSIDWPVLYDLLNKENLLEDLRAEGYDAVVLDFTEAVDPIQRNAFVLTRLLERVNEEIPGGQSMALVGASMGGLVARYALLWMEQQAIPHGVRTLISFDAPQSGANIPLGLQDWVSFFSTEAEEAEYLLSRLNAPASRQMLLYHLGSVAGTTANPDPLKAALESELLSMGNWPQAPRLVSVINGSGSTAGQGFNAGDQIIFYEYRSLLADIDGNVWAVPDGGSQLIFDGMIDIILVGGSDKSLTVAGTLPWDNSPGGSRASMDQMADVNAPYGDIIALHGSHSFIPTISGLALDATDPFYDVAGDAELLDHSAFDQVYFPAENQEHIAITPENKNWLLEEVRSAITVSLISEDTTEAGGSATFTVAAVTPPAAPVTISLSSSNPAEGTVAASVVLPAGSTAAQTVTVTGVDDEVADGNVMYTIITGPSSSTDKAYHGTNPPDVAVVNLDDDQEESIFADGFEP
jgi:hypothetical protein